jgi:hypothetical protein
VFVAPFWTMLPLHVFHLPCQSKYGCLISRVCISSSARQTQFTTARPLVYLRPQLTHSTRLVVAHPFACPARRRSRLSSSSPWTASRWSP